MKLRKLWQGLDAGHKNIVLYLVYSPSPVSINTLCALSGASPADVLDVVHTLRKKKLIYEKDGFPKGTYILGGTALSDFMEGQAPQDEVRRILAEIARYCMTSLKEGDGKTLVLAELYRMLGETDDGLAYIKKGADILFRGADKEKAVIYYDYVLKTIKDDNLTARNVILFLESVQGRLSFTRPRLPIYEVLDLLTRAENAAQRFRMQKQALWIKLQLGYHLMNFLKDTKKGLYYINNAKKLAEKIGDHSIARIAVLYICQSFQSRGRLSEVISHYQKVLSNLEAFGDDEIALIASGRVGLCYVLCGKIARGIGMIDAVRAKAEQLNLQHATASADTQSVLALLEIRRTSEAEVYVNRLCSLPDTVLGLYLLRILYLCRAYISYANGDYQEAFEFHKKAAGYGNLSDWKGNKFPWTFEYMDALENKGFFSEEMNYDREIENALKGDDIYMKGVGFRYRALRTMERGEDNQTVLSDLKNSEKHLLKGSAEIELARTRIALGNYYLKRGDAEPGQAYLGRAWAALSKIDRNLFPKDLMSVIPQKQKIEVTIDRMVSINESLTTIQDGSVFLQKVLNIAMDLTMATRGAFFGIAPDGGPKIIASRNLDPALLQTESFKPIMDNIAEAVRQGKELITDSFMLMPARLGDTIQGHLYLDNRFGKEPFHEEYLAYTRLLSSQIAVGLSNIRMHDELRQRKERFEDEAVFYKKELGIASRIETIIGKSDNIKRVIDRIGQVASTNSSVLITGETGVGKELVAKAIHNLSPRRAGPFIPVNLSALPQELVAGELFGHEKGAFTGANERYKGRFEIADGGTIFLDEIGDLPPNIQVKLLRVLQEGLFERLGSTKPIRSDFRVVAATHRALSKEVEGGAFRQDLYYRLNVFPISIPPLRERKEDIPLLAHHFLDKYTKEMGKRIRGIPKEGLRKLIDYHWPGNVRELKHLVERAVILSNGGEISFSGLDRPDSMPGENMRSTSLADLERAHIEKILSTTHWRVYGPGGAASLLGLKPTTLYYRMKKLGVKKPV